MTQQVAQLLFDNIIKLHGFPHSIVLDRDKIFTSTLWYELFGLYGMSLLLNLAYQPQTDGQTECIN
jgi:hypothetical protein